MHQDAKDRLDAIRWRAMSQMLVTSNQPAIDTMEAVLFPDGNDESPIDAETLDRAIDAAIEKHGIGVA